MSLPVRFASCFAWIGIVVAQAPEARRGAEVPPQPPPAAAAASAGPQWTISATAYTFDVPGEHEYLQATLLADRDWMHFETRWNYESLDTASAWFGCTLEAGDDLRLEITPMVGAVFGETNGIASGFRGTLSWWQLDLFSESEYVIATGSDSEDFLYTWSELAWSPSEWLRVGVVAQRTRAFETQLDVQRGLLLGLSFERFDATVYLLNPDESEPILVLGVGLEF